MRAPSSPATARAHDMLRLTLLPGLGPIRSERVLKAFGGSVDAALGASHAAWQAVPGIGPVIARRAIEAVPSLAGRVEAELELVQSHGAHLVARGDPEYPPLLAELADAPRLLYIRGNLDLSGADRYPVAIVGSRRCTQYGIEQAERFGGVLSRSGLTVVSGGARGIDTAAHRGALRSGGRTIAVQGCGLARSYPPENEVLYERIVAEGHGAIVSELPMLTEPKGEHFPARNRIISGLSLGVLVIEAATKSGALITAKIAAEEHGREVMVVPGRVDSASSAGSHMLLKIGGAALVTDPGDVINALEAPARFHHHGVHEDRYGAHPLNPTAGPEPVCEHMPASVQVHGVGSESRGGIRDAVISLDSTIDTPDESSDDIDAVIRACATEGAGFDEIVRSSGLGPERVRVALTMLELGGRVRRSGGRFEAIHPQGCACKST